MIASRAFHPANQKQWQIGLMLCVAGMVLCSGCAQNRWPASVAGTRLQQFIPGELHKGFRSLTGTELQVLLMEYSDAYLESVSFGFDQLYALTTGTQQRAMLMANKVFYVSAATSIAADADPLKGLMDMMIMLHLQCDAWSMPAITAQFDGKAELVHKRLVDLDRDIWQLGGEVFPEKALELLQKLIAQWRRLHPKQTYVAYTRFLHLPEAPEKTELQKFLNPSVLLKPVKDAARSLDDARRTTERAVFVAERMPIFLVMHSQLAYLSIASEPEVQKLLRVSDQLTSISGSFVGEVRNLPENLREERRELLRELTELIANERRHTIEAFSLAMDEQRNALFLQLNEQQGAWQSSMGATGDAMESASLLLARFEATTTRTMPLLQAARDAGITFDALAGKLAGLKGSFDSPGGGQPGWDAESIQATLRELQTTADRLNAMLLNLQAFSDTALTGQNLEGMNQSANAQINAIFFRALILIVVASLGLTAALTLPRMISRKRDVREQSSI